MPLAAVEFTSKAFGELTLDELYAMLKLRAEVFVVEQQCTYLDPDGRDPGAQHLLGWSSDASRALICGARVLKPGAIYEEASIGRVVTSPAHRGTGLARQVMERALEECARLYPEQPIRIEAQQYVERFYGSLGFVTVSEPFEEDGILHVMMLRPG